MKIASIILLGIIITASVTSCKKDTFITSPNAIVALSTDTLYFDTVFTTTGSITGEFKIFNQNNQKLLLSNVQLMGGATSYFKFNLDGSPGTVFNNVTIAANDSLYGFVIVTINPNDSLLPFIIRDSIRIVYNGDTAFLQLEAYGQNANFLRNAVITKDTAWNNKLPIVLLGGLTVNTGATLTIQQATKVYVNAQAPITINGTLQAFGANDSNGAVSFQCDRLDPPYNGFPGSWPGITFTSSSTNNVMQYCILKNAYEGIAVQGPAASSPVLTLNQCILNNIYDVAIGGTNSSIAATNCLVSNCGSNVSITSGGNYTFNQCTIASYDNSYVSHINPVVSVTNSDVNNVAYPLSCTFTNSILYGTGNLVSNEVVFYNNTGATFNANLVNVLYKDSTMAINPIVNVNQYCILNQLPGFNNINPVNLTFDFHLASGSPCLNAGTANPTVTIDLDGKPRVTQTPDLGCYQTQ
jgi:hypothetical protein